MGKLIDRIKKWLDSGSSFKDPIGIKPPPIKPKEPITIATSRIFAEKIAVRK